MGFTLNQLEQERQIRKLQKKEDKDTKDYEQLSNLPKINNVELKGNKTTSDLGINADNVMMSDGTTSVEDALDGLMGGYTTISTTDTVITTNTEIAIADIHGYKNIILVGYVGSNAGGKRWYMYIPTCLAFSTAYQGLSYANGNLLVISFMLLTNKISLTSGTSDTHVIGVYGSK